MSIYLYIFLNRANTFAAWESPCEPSGVVLLISIIIKLNFNFKNFEKMFFLVR